MIARKTTNKTPEINKMSKEERKSFFINQTNKICERNDHALRRLEMSNGNKGVEINGCIFANEGDVDHDEFWVAFIQFIESKGWYFGGGTKQIDEDGNVLDE